MEESLIELGIIFMNWYWSRLTAVCITGKKYKNKSRSPRITGDHGFSPGNRTGELRTYSLWWL